MDCDVCKDGDTGRVTRMVNMMMGEADEMTELASFRPNPVTDKPACHYHVKIKFPLRVFSLIAWYPGITETLYKKTTK